MVEFIIGFVNCNVWSIGLNWLACNLLNFLLKVIKMIWLILWLLWRWWIDLICILWVLRLWCNRICRFCIGFVLKEWVEELNKWIRYVDCWLNMVLLFCEVFNNWGELFFGGLRILNLVLVLNFGFYFESFRKNWLLLMILLIGVINEL